MKVGLPQLGQRVAQGTQHRLILGIEGIHVATGPHDNAVVHACAWDHLVRLQQQRQRLGLERRLSSLERDHPLEHGNDISEVLLRERLEARLLWRVPIAWPRAQHQRPDRLGVAGEHGPDRLFDLRKVLHLGQADRDAPNAFVVLLFGGAVAQLAVVQCSFAAGRFIAHSHLPGDELVAGIRCGHRPPVDVLDDTLLGHAVEPSRGVPQAGEVRHPVGAPEAPHSPQPLRERHLRRLTLVSP